MLSLKNMLVVVFLATVCGADFLAGTPVNAHWQHPHRALEQSDAPKLETLWHRLDKYFAAKRDNIVKQLKKNKAFHYPCLEVEKWLRKEVDNTTMPIFSRGQRPTLPIIGFDSLASTQSALRSFTPEEVATARPAVAFGARRIFNYAFKTCRGEMKRKLTNEYLSGAVEDDAALFELVTGGVLGSYKFTHKDPCVETAVAVLNIENFPHYKYKKLSAARGTFPLLTGVVYDLKDETIKKVRCRESGYNLVPLAYIPWGAAKDASEEELLQTRFEVAYALVVPPGKECIVKDPSEAYPVPNYFKICRQAQFDVDELFAEMYDVTTVLADGVTTAGDWQKLMEKKDRRTLEIDDPKCEEQQPSSQDPKSVVLGKKKASEAAKDE
ncbi:unnamed protein product [Vitrella brassicaformis CCMP3155]|uniref:Uncharacterized protein n=1 Tax=Vitrella brassicaformis (strain CCMP3155) TaxID=1169540 RepID=A0A0G4G022_VITBC|nr:unnamed protein product [Vitrella brassicaformis CCMP3155]|eukprot:CEM20857.1 unnamed protein product [Vitrella brassicaformis CCMP3155]